MEHNKQLRYRKTKYILGEGSYKTVSKAIDEEEGKEVAYNEVKIKYDDERSENEAQVLNSFSKEIALLKTVDHPNIIKIVDYWFSEENFIFITELMTGGSLKDYIKKHGQLSTKLIRKWGRQILEGLRYLHGLEPPIIHRDIKNENIFVNTAVGEVKIGDLGLAREKRHKRYTIVGTPHFMAREMFEGEGYTEKVDVYAFGMCLVEMATGRTPYGELKDTTEVYRCVLQGVHPRGLQEVGDPCLRGLIMQCLGPPGTRLRADECLEHHFFSGQCPGECEAGEQEGKGKGMELSVISLEGRTAVFQILVYETMKFIKFEYDMERDTVGKVCDELLAEEILDEGAVEAFSRMLVNALEGVGSGRLEGEESMPQAVAHSETSQVTSESMQSGCFGAETLEEMRLIEESMKMAEARRELGSASETCSVELSKSVKFKNEKREILDFISEDIYSQFPNATSAGGSSGVSSGVSSANITNLSNITSAGMSNANLNGTSAGVSNANLTNLTNLTNSTSADTSPDISLNTTVDTPLDIISLKMEDLCIKEGPTKDSCIKIPPISSPPFGITRLTEEQAVNDISLSEGYETCRVKYKSNYPIAQYALDAAAITGRTEETAKSWIKALRDEDIETVFDLKLMVYEDWESLPLTVFSCRAMQNMLYGIDGVPPREKQLPLNPKMKEYDNRMSIKNFLEDVCETVNRRELVSRWEDRLLAQDIQTVGELKSLHHEDWNRLSLSVYAYRILKNVIFRKGKILIDYF